MKQCYLRQEISEKSESVYSFVISGAEITGSALITVIVKDTVFEEY